MKTIPLSSIQIAPNRQRKVFDLVALNALADSIKNTAAGLLQPIVVRPGLDGAPTLVAGERRLRAVSDIYALGGRIFHNGVLVPEGEIPVVELAELSPLDAWEAELEENIRRADLTWQERAAATSELLALRSAQAQAAGLPPPAITAIAEERQGDRTFAGAAEATRRELIVSKHLDDVEVAAAPSLKEAFAILKKKDQAREHAELAAVVGKAYSTEVHRLVNADCLEWMRGSPASAFDVILSDPPYGMGADTFSDSGTGRALSHAYDDSYEVWEKLMEELPNALFAAAAEHAHCYLFCDFDRFHELRDRMHGAGWRVHRTPLIWNNPSGFRVPWPDFGPQRKYELVLFAVKGEKKVNMIAPDVLTHARESSTGHLAQKPVPLLLDLLRRSAKPDDRVFDPFMGSGSTIEACHQLRLTATGIELDPAHYGTAVKRIAELGELEKALL